ncbi:unnamed protein product [Prorocentrum cordatum]|uniref:C3H1-type domain-containing protein n=1 Tax=Prorocentrum cordatum TaxID=2364126 RepID=A0ABN9WTS6_9DINO|nr:unnamed protein product [Polarella glacialis]
MSGAAAQAVGPTDFEAATWPERASFEAAFVAAAAAYAALLAVAREAPLWHDGAVPLAAALASCLVHAVTLAARVKWRRSFWLPVFTVVIDCVISAVTHVEVQTAFWKELYKPFGVSGQDTLVRDFEGMFGWHSLFHTSLLYVSLSYMTHFVLLARHATLALLLGVAAFGGVLFTARSVLESRGQFRDARRECMEMFLFAFGMVIQVASKFRAERSSRKIFEHLSELQIESLRQSSEGPPSIADGGSHDPRPSPRCERPRVPSGRRGPASLGPSVQSAPADMLPSALQVLAGVHALQDAACPGGALDCFQPSAAVWVSGEAEPVPVGRLVPGQRVLCFDSLGGSVKYAQVSEVLADAEALEWVEVALADGTTLTMTSDHPVQPLGQHGRHLREKPVPASSLVPLRDSVMVHRVATLPVAVHSVTRREATAAMRERVSVCVHQPDRYAILVVTGGGARASSMAVGSADARGALQHQSQVKNTFVHVCPDGGAGRARAASEPRPRGGRAWAVDCASSASSLVVASQLSALVPCGREGLEEDAEHDGATCEPVVGPEGSVEIVCHQSFGGLPLQLLPRGMEGLQAYQERDGAHSQAPVSPDGVAEVVCRQSIGGMSALLREESQPAAAAEGEKLPSIGSVGHHEGECQPCQLHFRGKCLRGCKCNFCHLPHLGDEGARQENPAASLSAGQRARQGARRTLSRSAPPSAGAHAAAGVAASGGPASRWGEGGPKAVVASEPSRGIEGRPAAGARTQEASGVVSGRERLCRHCMTAPFGQAAAEMPQCSVSPAPQVKDTGGSPSDDSMSS